MIRFAKVTPVCCLAAASALALAQPPVAPPAPPAPPMVAPAPTPVAVPAPAAPTVRVSPKVYLEGMPDVNIDVGAIQAKVDAALSNIDFDQINEQVARIAAMNADRMTQQAAEAYRQVQDQYGNVQDMVRRAEEQYLAFAQQTPMPKPATAPMPPMPPGQPRTFFSGQNVRAFNFKGGSAENIYDRGQRDLDNYNFDQALDAFNEVANRGGARADAALYWKAYTLNKLGRKDDATAALNELRTKYASSRWLDDAKALEIEVRQSSGQKVTPESQSNDELKLLALNGLAQSDPDRALPALDKILKGAQSPKLKKEAIFVMASSSAPKAQQMLEQIARGSGNPDLQLQAILYIGRTGKQANRGQLLMEIYNSTSDQAVKHAVLNALQYMRDKDHIIQLAKSEKNPDLRLDAINSLGGTADQAEMWQFYQQETDPNVKAELLRRMSGNTDKLIEIARTDKDARLRRTAIQSLASVRAANTTDALVSIYGTEPDPQVKRAIISALTGQRNVQALIQLGRKETDPDLRRSIVRSVVDMHSPEAADFLQEILNK